MAYPSERVADSHRLFLPELVEYVGRPRVQAHERSSRMSIRREHRGSGDGFQDAFRGGEMFPTPEHCAVEGKNDRLEQGRV